MAVLPNVSIRAKLLISFAILTLIIIGVGLFAYTRTVQMAMNSEKMYEKNLKPIAVTSKMGETFQRARVNVRDVLLARTTSEQQKYLAITAVITKDLDKYIVEYELLITSEEERKAFENFKQCIAEYYALRKRLYDLEMQGQHAQVLEIVEQECQPLSEKTVVTLLQLVDVNKKSAEIKNNENHESIAQMQMTIFFTIGFGVLLSLVLGYLIMQSVLEPLKKLKVANHFLANGELSKVTIDIYGKDEFAVLADSKRVVIQTLKDLLLETD